MIIELGQGSIGRMLASAWSVLIVISAALGIILLKLSLTVL